MSESIPFGDVAADGKFTLVVPCLFKGQVAASGQLLIVEDSTKYAYDVDVKMAYEKCRQGSDAGVFVLDGTLRKVSSEKYDDVAQTHSADRHLTGTIDWSVDKTSGSCDVDLTLAVRATATTGSSNVTGTFCGTTFPKP